MSDLLSNTLPRSGPLTLRKTQTYLRMSSVALQNPYPNFTIYLTPPACPVLISQLFLVAVLVLIFSTVFRILNHFTNLNPIIYFTLRLSSVTRGHPFTLCKPPARLDSCKFSFFSRVIDLWNSLPIVVVEAGSVSAFKARLKHISF